MSTLIRTLHCIEVRLNPMQGQYQPQVKLAKHHLAGLIDGQ